MKNGTEKYIETVQYFARLYDFCNDRLFEGKLKKPVITVQCDERNKTLGWWSVKKVWKWTEKAPANCADCGEDRDSCSDFLNCFQFVECEEHELNLTAQQLNRPFPEIAATMIHEQCHQYACLNNIKDTSRGGVYHNKQYKKIAEEHGLKVACVKTIGWSDTYLTEATSALISEFVKDNPVDIIYRLPVLKGQSVKSSSTRKYVCPVCGNSVRATKEVHILCADCNQIMSEE